MLRIYIGPNGYGKTYAINSKIEELKKEDKNRKDIIMLNSEIVFSDEMKDSVNNSFVMEYLIEELLENDDINTAKNNYEKLIDKNVEENKKMYNDIMNEVLSLNNQQRKKDVIDTTSSKEHKKLIKINSDDLKNSMGSGQKLQFLLKLIEKSNKKYIFLDEPENHTHPSLLHITAGLINKLSIDKDVCIATHSPELLSLLNIDFNELYIFNDPNYGNPKKINFNDAVSISKSIHLDNLNNKSKTYYNALSFKKNIIELHKKEFFEAIFSKKVYMIEGVNDLLFLKSLLVKNLEQYNQYSIFQCYGKPHYLPFINVFEQLGIEVVPLFDIDEKNDSNNVLINEEIKKCKKYLEFDDNLENELNYLGKKTDTTAFIEFLYNFNNYKKYSSIFDGSDENV